MPIRKPSEQALSLLKDVTVQSAIKHAREVWLTAGAPDSAEMLPLFDEAFSEVTFCALMWSVDRDAEHPHVVTMTRLPHRLKGMEVPGSRYGIDNPDNIYRVIPVDAQGSFIITGAVVGKRPVEGDFSLWTADGATISNLAARDLKIDADGHFTITVDPNPANGRPNHIQSTPAAKLIFIRDIVADWAAQRPLQLTVKRIGPAAGPAPDRSAEAAVAAKYVKDYVDNSIRWVALEAKPPVNSFAKPYTQTTDQALSSQAYSNGHFEIAGRRSARIDLRTGGAAYITVPVTNSWGTTLDIVHRTTSLNSAQALPNPDGSYTFVVSPKDPGVHNWVDTNGCIRGDHHAVGQLPGGHAGVGLASVDSNLVKLETVLPAGTKTMSPTERAAQQQARAASYAWHY